MWLNMFDLMEFSILWLIEFFLFFLSFPNCSSINFRRPRSSRRSSSRVGAATSLFSAAITAFPPPCRAADSAFRTVPLRRRIPRTAEPIGCGNGFLQDQPFERRQQQRQRHGCQPGRRKQEPGRIQSSQGSWEQHCNLWGRGRRRRRRQQPSPASGRCRAICA